MENSTPHQGNVILVKKATGEQELFAVDKLERSLSKAGADDEVIQQIVADVQAWIFNGVTTHEIYSRAFSLLNDQTSVAASRYSLKKAMMEMGPTGFPFEQFIGLLFQKQGYDIEVGIIVQGKSITHEMDVIATHDKLQHIVECKYHKDHIHINIQVPLYVRSRVNDIVYYRQQQPQFQDFSFVGWVVTNTRFSDDSRQYAQANDLRLLGWDYPVGDGLKEWIERYNIYPITILKNLSQPEKLFLMEQGVVSCNQLLDQPEVLKRFDLSEEDYKLILDELTEVC
jgi:hypothetical protein